MKCSADVVTMCDGDDEGCGFCGQHCIYGEVCVAHGDHPDPVAMKKLSRELLAGYYRDHPNAEKALQGVPVDKEPDYDTEESR